MLMGRSLAIGDGVALCPLYCSVSGDKEIHGEAKNGLLLLTGQQDEPAFVLVVHGKLQQSDIVS